MSDLDLTEADTRDECDAYAILDHIPVREQAFCELCNSVECRHLCGYCELSRPCPCDAGGEISQRDFRAMEARFGDRPTRRRP